MQPSVLVVPDVQDVYTPFQNDLIVPLSEVSLCSYFYIFLCCSILLLSKFNSISESSLQATPVLYKNIVETDEVSRKLWQLVTANYEKLI